MKSEWIPYGKTFEQFCADDLNDRGVFILVDGRAFLIGDINKIGGVCEDCMDFGPHSIVTHYVHGQPTRPGLPVVVPSPTMPWEKPRAEPPKESAP